MRMVVSPERVVDGPLRFIRDYPPANRVDGGDGLHHRHIVKTLDIAHCPNSFAAMPCALNATPLSTNWLLLLITRSKFGLATCVSGLITGPIGSGMITTGVS